MKLVADSTYGSTRLLAAGDPDPVIVANPGAGSPFLLLGDHAGRAIPATLGQLGLTPSALDRHIAWDIGIAGLGARLSERLEATFISQAYSRLVIDCNRRPGAPGSIAEVSDETAVPGNAALSSDAAAARLREIYAPYQDRIAQELDRRAGRRTIIVSLHSFTPALQGRPRPWLYGVLHQHDSPFSLAMLAALRNRFGEAAVGDNQPYAMDGTDNTVPLHAGGRGLDYLELEVRQDLLAHAAGQESVADALAPLLTAALATLAPGEGL